MKAAFIRETGSPDVIQYDDLPDPEPGMGEVLIHVGAVAVNPIDTYIRSGAVSLDLPEPYILGCDVAGTVLETGPGVERFRKGDRVWGSNQGLLGRQGTFAERVVVHEDWLYPTPYSLNDLEAVAGALVGITAHLGLFQQAQLKEGEIVFVNGGTGGVGSSVVQLAKAVGARVIATVGSKEKAERCEKLGADLVLDYHHDDIDEQIRAFCEGDADGNGPAGVNVWYETQREPTLERTIDLMAPRGRIVLMAGRDAHPQFPLGSFYTRNLKILGFAMFNATADEQRICAESISGLAEGGLWTPLIGKTLSLSEAATAHKLQEQNTLERSGTLTGKIVLTPEG